MAMPKAPQSINYNPDTDTVDGYDSDGARFTDRPLASVPNTFVRVLATRYGVPAGVGVTKEAMVDGIRAAANGGSIPTPTPDPVPTPNREARRNGAPSTDPATMLTDAIRALSVVDEDTVIRLIHEHAPQSTARTLVVERPEAPSVTIDGAHPLFEETLRRTVRRPRSGRYVYLVGPAGSGKSTVARQVATALGLPFYSQAMAPIPQDHLFSGFVNAYGAFVETAFYRWAKDGGVFLLDEMDASYASTIVLLNDALASRRFTFPNGETVDFHPDAHLIGAGNTVGRGADSTYTARVVQDGAALDRFTVLRMAYSADVERSMMLSTGCDAATVDRLATTVERCRAVIAEQGLTVVLSPRAAMSIAAAIADGDSWSDAWAADFLNAQDADTVRKFAPVIGL